MNRIISKTKELNEHQGLLVWMLFSVLVFLVFLYLFFINNAVMNISAHENNKEEIIALESELSGLELSYIELSGNLDMLLAKELGFSDIGKNSSFVIRKSSSVTLARKALDEI